MRTRWSSALLALCFAATTAACAGDRAPDAERRPDGAAGTSGSAVPDPAKRDADREPGMADRDFVVDMIAGSRVEVELGKLAQQKARHSQVKAFATQMVRDHQKAAAELKTVSTRANIDIPKIDADMEPGKDLRDRLAKLSGMEFDRQYMKAMVDDHEKALNEAEEKAEKADNDHVKQWAAKALPTLKKHLEQARHIRESLEKSGT